MTQRQHVSDALLRNRRVGYKNDRAAFAAKSRERGASAREGRDAVVYDAPDVAKEHVVTAEQLASVIEDWRCAMTPLL